jgi:peptide/nickel transport system substrate-binding protein
VNPSKSNAPQAGRGLLDSVPSMSRRRFFQVAGFTVAVGSSSTLLAACAGSEPASGGSSSTDRLVVSSASATTSYDPDVPEGAVPIIPMVYDALFNTALPGNDAEAQAKLNNYEPTPGLAKSWTVNDAGTVWTFQLDTAAKSVAGNTLKADDVVWSMSRHLAMDHYQGFFLNNLAVEAPEQIVALSDSEVQFNLSRPVNRTYFLQVLGGYIMSIFDSQEAKKHVTDADPWAKDWLSKNVATFGPYSVTSSTPDGAQAEYAANTGYYGSAPIPTVVWRQTTESSAALQLLLSGDVQLIDPISPQQTESVESSSDAKVSYVPSPGGVFLGFNSAIAPFGDVAFRQGVAAALPVTDIVDGIYKGKATLSKSVIPSFYQGYTDAYAYSSDVAKAKTTLAPYASQKLTLQYKAGDAAAQGLAVAVQTGMQAAGVAIEIEGLNPASYQTMLNNKELSWWVDPQSTPLVPNTLYRLQQLFVTEPIQACLNYSNPELDAVVAQIEVEQNLDAQVRLFARAQEILMRDLPIIPLVDLPKNIPSAKNVSGFEFDSSAAAWFKDLQYS